LQAVYIKKTSETHFADGIIFVDETIFRSISQKKKDVKINPSSLAS